MRFFRRKEGPDVDPNERSPQLGLRFKDLAVLGALMDSGADITQPREVIFYSYAPSREIAQAMASEASANGFRSEVREPLPEFPGQWALVCQTQTVLTPAFVRDTVDYFEELATRHSAEYDGWEASA
jgi:Regulator of ribonuclease activity B